METKEISERYYAPCFVNGLEAYDGEINLEHDKNLISNKFAIKLCLEHEVKNRLKCVKKELIVALRGEIYFVKFIINPEEDDIKPGVVLGRSFLRLTKGIADFGNEIITIYLNLDPFNDVDSDKANDSKDDWEVILEDIDFEDIPEIDGLELPPYVYNMGKSSRDKKKPHRNYKMTHNKPRPIIKTIKFIDQHKKLLDSVMLDRLKLDGEIEANEEEATKEVIKGYKTLREKDDPGVFVLPIRLEANIDSFALADIGSNINVMPYQIYTKLGREDAKPIAKKITMLNHSKAEPMGILRDVLCQIGVTIILAKFLILYMPVDKDVPIVVGRSFLYTCGGIIDTIKKTTSTFDGICHQDFYVAAVKSKEEEKDSEDGEEYYVKREMNGKPFYGPDPANYLNCDDPSDRALALQEALNPFKNVCVWKKMVAFLGSLPVPLQHMEWIPSYSNNFFKKGW
ncbi:retrovirus-related pol polyprotein from transposon TNT 1-94 [Tanacetum coccineum]